MKTKFIVLLGVMSLLFGCGPKDSKVMDTVSTEKKLFLDVHDIGPGVTFEAVAGAHQKDLATQGEFDVNFIKYWVDEKAGKVYCLAESSSQANLFKTHEKAHGLVPGLYYGGSQRP